MLLAVVFALPAWSAPSVSSAISPEGWRVHTITFDATSDDSVAFGLGPSCSVRLVTYGGSGTATLYQVPTEATATGSGTSVAAFTAVSSATTTFQPGQRYAKAAGASDGSIMEVWCSNTQVSSGGGGTLLEEVAACSANFTKPEGCPGATFVTTQAAAESCFSGANDPICVLTETITIEASDRDSSGATDLEGLYLAKADGDEDPKLVCAPEVEIRVNATTTTGVLALIHVEGGSIGSGDAGSFPGVHGCSVVEYHNSSVGGSTRTTEGVVYKMTGSLLTYRQAFEVSDSEVYVYSTGSSSMGIGVNPVGYVDGFYRRNLIYSPLGIDAKIRCDGGCDDASVLVEDSIILVNETDTTSPRIIKVDDDANVIYQRNVSHGGAIGLDATQSATYSAGVVQLYDSTFSDITTAAQFFQQANTTPTQTVIGRGLTFSNVNPTTDFWLTTGGLNADVEGRYLDCPTTFTEWLDIANIASPDVMGDVRLVIDLPDGCSDSKTLLSSRGLTEIDVEGTKAFVKVENRFIEVDGAQTDVDGPGVITGSTAKFTDEYGVPIFVAASPSTSFDTGSEVAGHAGYQCLNVYVASSGALITDGDADGYTCDETISAASIVMVHSGVQP